MSGQSDFKPEPRIKNARAGLAKCLRERRCRVCGVGYGIVRHHLVAKGRGQTGDDVDNNIVPICNEHHQLVHNHHLATRRKLRASLSEAELGYVEAKKGTAWLERYLPAPEDSSPASRAEGLRG